MIPGYLGAVGIDHDLVSNSLHDRADILIAQLDVMEQRLDERAVLALAVERYMSGCRRVGDEGSGGGREFCQALAEPKIFGFGLVADKREPATPLAKGFFIFAGKWIIPAATEYPSLKEDNDAFALGWDVNIGYQWQFLPKLNFVGRYRALSKSSPATNKHQMSFVIDHGPEIGIGNSF